MLREPCRTQFLLLSRQATRKGDSKAFQEPTRGVPAMLGAVRAKAVLWADGNVPRQGEGRQASVIRSSLSSVRWRRLEACLSLCCQVV